MTEGKPNWRPMWENLGINMEKHDMLLGALPEIYKSIYIDVQKNRPEGMGFFEFVVGDNVVVAYNAAIAKITPIIPTPIPL